MCLKTYINCLKLILTIKTILFDNVLLKKFKKAVIINAFLTEQGK
jgi:hypothetical protein